MNSMMKIGRQTKHAAGLAALVATLFTTTGTLALADHYARTGGLERRQVAANPATRYALPASSPQTVYAQAATQS